MPGACTQRGSAYILHSAYLAQGEWIGTPKVITKGGITDEMKTYQSLRRIQLAWERESKAAAKKLAADARAQNAADKREREGAGGGPAPKRKKGGK